MKYFISFLIILFVFLNSFGQFTDSGKNAIVELKKAEYNIVSLDKTLLSYKYQVKILNNKGEKYGNIEIPFDNNSHLVNFKGYLFDANGEKIRNISKADLYTVSNFSNYSLYSDDKSKTYSIHYFAYPYIVEYEYEIEFKGFLGCYWTLLEDYDIPSKCVELIIKSPKEIDFSFKTNKFYGTHDTITQGNIKTNTWRAANINSIPKEEFTPGFTDLIPSILISPKQFRYEGYYGMNDSWENYGKWVWNLLENRNTLAIETILKIHELTDSITDTIAKIKCIYKYFQANTRYISIQKGIGGFQPISAAIVDQCKYGDCKALSNYLKSLLSIIGVNAIYTEIGNGRDKRIKWDDLPSVYQTNHVILSIPFHNDTIWLECTNSNVPFGYIGSGNSNRQALYITESGGKIVNTLRYGLEDNYRVTNATVLLNKDGSMQCNAEYKTSGVLMDELINLEGFDRKGQEKLIFEQYPSVNLEIEDFSINETKDIFPKMTFNIKMTEFGFLSKTSGFYSFKPGYLNKINNSLKPNERRENYIFFQNSYMYTDTIKFILPKSFGPEYLPENKTFESVFGKYHTEYFLSKNEFLYIRTFIMHEGLFTSDKYRELNDFLNKAQTADNQNVIFKEN